MVDDNNQTTNEEQAFKALDTQKVIKEVSPILEKKAEEKAQKIVEERLSKFGDAISGGGDKNDWEWSAKDSHGRPAPSSWEEGAEKIATKAEERITKKIMDKIDKKEKSNIEQGRQAEEQRKKQMDVTMAEWDEDWKALIDEGDMPAMSEESQKLIKEGKREQVKVDNDPGLKARWSLIQSAMDHQKKTGKKVNLYRYAKNQYNKHPGKDAPVFGGGRGTVQPTEEKSYEDIRAKREQIFGR